MYDKVSTDLKFVEREKEVEKFWEDEHIFEKSIKNRQWQAPYRPRGNPRHQGHDSKIPGHEGLHGAP